MDVTERVRELRAEAMEYRHQARLGGHFADFYSKKASELSAEADELDGTAERRRAEREAIRRKIAAEEKHDHPQPKSRGWYMANVATYQLNLMLTRRAS